MRYAAITPETIGDEYQKALVRLATKYRLPPLPSPPAENASDPDQLLGHLARWVRQHATSSQAPRALLRRIERLQRDVRNLKASVKKTSGVEGSTRDTADRGAHPIGCSDSIHEFIWHVARNAL